MKNILDNIAKKNMTERVTLYIALLLAVPNIPNLLFRLFQQNWLFAGIDAVAVLVGFAVAIAVMHDFKIYIMQIILSILIAISILLIVKFGNSDQFFWVFPGVASFFFLLRPPVALLFALSVLLFIFPLTFDVSTVTKMSFYTAMMPTVLFMYFCAREMRVQHSHLSLLATEDFLTKTGNRRAFQQDSEDSLNNFKRHKIPCSLILLDMDHFKRLNDTFGHIAGDKVLKHSASLINQRLRRTDRLYRLGGEEFAILLNHGGVKEALSVAQDLQKYIDANADDSLPEYTLSMGLSQLKLGESIEDWMLRTDKALYASKENGRNRITTAH